MRLKSFTPKELVFKARVLLDRLNGLDFLTAVQPEEVGLDPEKVYRSTPSGGRHLTKVLRDLNITSEDSIVDIGCGKGNAMRTMLRFPFARVDGIELSEQIAAIARRNFQQMNEGRTRLFVHDASRFRDYDPYSIVYFYNPFPASVMSPVIDALLQSAGQLKRELVIIYNNPTCHDAIIAQGEFKKIGGYPSEWSSGISVYSNHEDGQDRLSINRNRQRTAESPGLLTIPAYVPAFVRRYLIMRSLEYLWKDICKWIYILLSTALSLVLASSDVMNVLDSIP